VSRGPVAHHDDTSRLKKHCLTLFQAVIGTYSNSTMGGSVVSVLDSGTEARVQIAAATMSGNSLRQIVHTHCASIHQAAKLVAALPRAAWVTAGQAERWQPTTGFMTHIICRLTARTGISSGTLHSVIEYGLPLPFYFGNLPSCHLLQASLIPVILPEFLQVVLLHEWVLGCNLAHWRQ